MIIGNINHVEMKTVIVLWNYFSLPQPKFIAMMGKLQT